MYKKPRTSLNIIEQNEWGKGIICLTACQVGRMSRLLVNGNETEAWQLWNKLKWIFDDVFMEIQSHDTPDQAEANAKIAAFIKSTIFRIPLQPMLICFPRKMLMHIQFL